MADECFGGAGTGDGYGFQLIDEFDYQRSSPSDVNMYNSVWASELSKPFTDAICCLSKMDQIEWASHATRNQVEAEARFHSVLLFISIWVKLIGQYSIGNQALLTKEEANIPQAIARGIVYELIET
jgi:starch-binding outer membrane protein, SusD/RagB family